MDSLWNAYVTWQEHIVIWKNTFWANTIFFMIFIRPKMKISNRIKYAALPFESIGKMGELHWQEYKLSEALLTDLSKAFNCLDHTLLTAKPMHIEFSLPALLLIHDFLSSRSKEQKLIRNIFRGQKYYLRFFKGQFFFHFFLVFSW